MQKTINLVIFSSALHDKGSVIQSRNDLFEGLRTIARLQIVYPSMLATGRRALEELMDGGRCNSHELLHEGDCKTVCFIATGGTEEMFKEYVDTLPRPVILLSDGLHNSFAASFEIKTYLSQHGIASTLYNAPLDYNPEFFADLDGGVFGGRQGDTLESGTTLPKFPKQVMRSFEKTCIGLIGGASGWLISSDIDREAVEAAYGAKFIDIPLSELEEAFFAIADGDPRIGPACRKMEGYLTGDRTPYDLQEAVKMYLALKDLCAKHNINALTLKCFGILGTCRTTACLAMALLNDEGIVSGCEGDIPSLWTMLYVRYAYARPAFMANPSSSLRRELTIDFAHCTIPLSMVHGYRLPSHFESQSGIGIAGSVPSGHYRIIKISGEKLDQYYETSGDIIMNTFIPQRCRTQIRFKFASEEEFDRFFRVSKGNHVILCKV